MTEIIRVLNMVRKTIEVTKKQAVTWARRVEEQGAQKSPIETTKNKKNDTVKRHKKRTITLKGQNQAEVKLE